jgi:hypothetical protein
MSEILKNIITWARSHMDVTIGKDFVKVLNYTLLAHYLSANKYDIDLFKEYINSPTDCHSELNDQCRKR